MRYHVDSGGSADDGDNNGDSDDDSDSDSDCDSNGDNGMYIVFIYKAHNTL